MTGVVFSPFAPYNDEASVIGDFSDWKDIPMAKGDDGTFRATVDLEDGTAAPTRASQRGLCASRSARNRRRDANFFPRDGRNH